MVNAPVYDSIASMLGAQPHEIARAEHATAAWNAAFWSIPMRAGQRIITHDHDYGANWIGFLRAVEVHGVRDRTDPERRQRTDRPRTAGRRRSARPDEVAVVSSAWIPTSGGLVNPAAAVGALDASGRRAVPAGRVSGGRSSSSSTSMRIGCDFLSATGRKFLRGPWGTGFLYVREDILDRVTPAQPDHHGADWVALDRYEFAEGARRFEYWEFDHAAWLGLGAAVDHAVPARDRSNRRHDRSPRRRSPTRAVHHRDGGPRPGHRSLRHRDGDAPHGLVRRGRRTARREQINVSTTSAGSARADMERRGLPPMVRMSVHCTTTADEIDRTDRALGTI